MVLAPKIHSLLPQLNIHLTGAAAAAAAAKSCQSCPTLCIPTDGSPPGSPIPGILQARTLEWVAISFSNACKWKVKVKSLSCVQLFVTPWTAAYQAPLSMGFSRQEYRSRVPLLSPIFYWFHHYQTNKSFPATMLIFLQHANSHRYLEEKSSFPWEYVCVCVCVCVCVHRAEDRQVHWDGQVSHHPGAHYIHYVIIYQAFTSVPGIMLGDVETMENKIDDSSFFWTMPFKNIFCES